MSSLTSIGRGKIRDGSTVVASVRVSAEGPELLLANHLEGAVPILIYHVENLADTIADMRSRGWEPDGSSLRFRMDRASRFATPMANDSRCISSFERR